MFTETQNLIILLSSKTLNLHEARPLPKSNEPFWISEDSDDCTPMVFVADDAFPLTIHSMKTCGRVTTSF